MGASWLYMKSSSLQCLSNRFLNVLTFGAVTTESGNSFLTLVILYWEGLSSTTFNPPDIVSPRPLSGDMTRMQFN